jgi:hypothetical protein
MPVKSSRERERLVSGRMTRVKLPKGGSSVMSSRSDSRTETPFRMNADSAFHRPSNDRGAANIVRSRTSSNGVVAVIGYPVVKQKIR